MTPTRTDVHSPTNMDPADYSFVMCFDPEGRKDIWSDKRKAAYTRANANLAPNAETGKCTHCGAWIRYHAILRHTPTGTYIFCGETCLDNRFSLLSKAEFDALRKAAELDRSKQRIVTAVTEWLTTLAGTTPQAVIDFLADKHDRNGHPARLWYGAINMRDRLWSYGYTLNDKQLAALAKALHEATPAVVAVKEAAKAEAKAAETMPPTGRTTVTGTVLTTKWQDSDFGSTLKMLVDVGTYRLWGSVPGKLQVSKGDTVTFSADVTAKEVGFGFYKRPTQAKVLESACVA